MITVPEEIKELLHLDHCKKNIRIHFPGGERSDICNDLIVKDSVSLTESLCSQNELKFGLCESPVFECEVVGVGNVAGARIEVFCEIYCDSSVSGAVFRPDLQAYVYPISYGQFVIDSCKREADMIHRRIQAYGFLSHMENTNEYIELKNKVLFPSATPYEPNMLGTFLMLAKATGRVNGLNYTVLTQWPARSGYVEKLYSWDYSSTSYYYGIWGNMVDISDYSSDPNTVIFVEYDRRSLEQISQEMMAAGWGLMTDNRFSIDEKNEMLKKMMFPGIGAGTYDTYNLTGFMNISARDDCNYIYTYAIASNSTPRSLFLTVPRGAIYDKNPHSFPGTPTHNTYDLSDRHIVVYAVDLSNYPEALYVLRDIYKTVKIEDPYTTPYTASGYVYDPTQIDYIKPFQSELETKGVFGTLKKDGSFAMINIKQQFGLNPGTAVYPGSNVYPEGVTGGKLLPEDYQSCWYDDDYTLPYGAVSCSYKNTNNEDCQYILYFTGFDENTDVKTYKTYDLNNNDYIKSNLWTENQIKAICTTIANNLEGVRYMPVDFVGRGLPYVDAGDTFEILTKSNDSITTIVLDRTLSGEQTLTDSYKSV